MCGTRRSCEHTAWRGGRGWSRGPAAARWPQQRAVSGRRRRRESGPSAPSCWRRCLAGAGCPNIRCPRWAATPTGWRSPPDGTAWFAESGANKIGKVNAGGSFTEYPVPPQPGDSGTLQGITVGADGNLWFTTYSYIGRMTPSGSFTFFPITRYNYAYDITPGPDGNVWFTEVLGIVGYVTPAGAVTEFSVGSGINSAYITARPAGCGSPAPVPAARTCIRSPRPGRWRSTCCRQLGAGISPAVPTGGCGSSAA